LREWKRNLWLGWCRKEFCRQENPGTPFAGLFIPGTDTHAARFGGQRFTGQLERCPRGIAAEGGAVFQPDFIAGRAGYRSPAQDGAAIF